MKLWPVPRRVQIQLPVWYHPRSPSQSHLYAISITICLTGTPHNVSIPLWWYVSRPLISWHDRKADTCWQWQIVRYCAKHKHFLTHVNAHSNTVRQVLLLSIFYKWRNKLRDLSNFQKDDTLQSSDLRQSDSNIVIWTQSSCWNSAAKSVDST